MQRKKMLTLDDLYSFFNKKKKNVNFSSKESGYKICVRTPALFEEEESDSETMMFANVRMFHIGRNRNNSGVTRQAAEKSLSGIKYKPVLAHIITIDEEEGIEDFHAHDMEISQNGEVTYIEKQVGCFTAQDPYIAHDDEHDKDYVYAQCAIPRDYTHAADIIERKGGTKVSVELLVNACSYNAKEKYLELTDVEVAGMALLGEDVGEGMVGSKLQLEDFAYSEEEAKISFSEDQMDTLIESLTGLQKTLESFNNSKGKEENTVADKEKINENLAEENLTEDELNENVAEFDGEDGGSDGDGGSEDSGSQESGDTGSEDDDPSEDESGGDDPDPSGDDDGGDDDSGEDDGEGEGEEEDNSATDGAKKRTINSIQREFDRDGLKFSVNFEVSHEDIRYALYNLISSWDEEDNDWYFIEKVYDDKFIASGFWTNQLWGSKYTVDGDNVNLEGDRYALHTEFLTDEELEQLNNMRSNYSALQEKVSKYELDELNAQRDEILNDEKYAKYQDADRFKELKENKEKYSLEDLRTQCELAFAAQFDGATTEQPQKQVFAQKPEKKEPKKSPKMFAFLQREDVSNEFLNGLMGRK